MIIKAAFEEVVLSSTLKDDNESFRWRTYPSRRAKAKTCVQEREEKWIQNFGHMPKNKQTHLDFYVTPSTKIKSNGSLNSV